MLRRDPELPFVDMAWAPHRMVEIFNRRILPAAWTEHEVAEVAIESVNYVPGTKCVIVYTLCSGDQSPNRSDRAVVTFAKDDALAEAHVRQVANQREHSHQRASCSGVVVPEYGCIVEIFPTDWNLPGLARAMQPAEATAFLPQVAANVCSDVSGRDPEIKVLRYRPHTRCVLQYALQSSDGERTTRLVGKIFVPGSRATRAWRLLKTLYSIALAGGVSMPKPLGIISHLNLVLMERVSGTPMKQIIESKDTDRARESTALAAATLSTLHGLRLESAPACTTLRDKVAKLHQRTASFHLVAPGFAQQVDSLLHRIALLTQALQVDVPCLVHGEYKPSQLLVDEDGRVTTVDFDGVCLGDPAIDVGNFMAELHRAALHTGQCELRQLSTYFLAEYQARRPTDGLAERALLMQSLALSRMALQSFQRAPFSYNDQGSTSRPAAFLREAVRCLPGHEMRSGWVPS